MTKAVMMKVSDGLDENIRFLIYEVKKQVVRTRSFLQQPTEKLHDSVLSKDDYIDNLKSIIERKCFTLASQVEPGDQVTVDLLKAFDVITVNLERISDFCENIIDQTEHIVEKELMKEFSFGPYFEQVVFGLDHIERALFSRQVPTALKICRAEDTLDQLYGRSFHDIIRRLKTGEGENVEALITLLFIFRYLERMGDSLLNIGEAIISACMGERIKISRFTALEDSLDAADLQDAADVALRPVGETKSGCRISRVSERSSPDTEKNVIFKEGRLHKLDDERRSIERWHQLMPGVAPQIHSFHSQGDNGSILFEYLPGKTFEELTLQGGAEAASRGLRSICDTVTELWEKTRKEDPASPRFMKQLRSRLHDVYDLHPEFRKQASSIGDVDLKSFEELVHALADLDEELAAPFSVFIHGDFNVDNVILNNGAVHFIDLHRSKMADYVQDVSVFLVSNHRLQVFDAPVRRTIHRTIATFFEFSRGFAHRAGDSTFDARLALGLARSLATSGRFVLDPGFAKSMFLRSQYLLEQLARHKGKPEEFRLSPEVLFD